MFSKKVLVGSIILMFALPTLALAHGHYRNSNRGTHKGSTPPPVVTPPPKPVPPPVVVPPVVVPPVSSGNEITLTAYLTSYQSGDNDPAGSTVTYINGVEGNAGGIGTYANPITIAVGYVGNVADYARGTMFYVPQLQKYFTAGDTCAECHKHPSGVNVWLDMYSGDYSSAKGLACEDAITANYTVIQNPKNTYPVNTTPLFDGTKCIK